MAISSALRSVAVFANRGIIPPAPTPAERGHDGLPYGNPTRPRRAGGPGAGGGSGPVRAGGPTRGDRARRRLIGRAPVPTPGRSASAAADSGSDPGHRATSQQGAALDESSASKAVRS